MISMYVLNYIRQPTLVGSCWWKDCSSWLPYCHIISINFAAGQYRFYRVCWHFSGPSQAGIRHNYLSRINMGFVLQLGGYTPLLPKHHVLVANSPLHLQSPRLQVTDLICECR